MAAVEQRPAVQERIPRSRSARLADQAATAALYVTHPERRLSLREPVTAEPDLQTLKATGSRPGFSHASALAALAHAKQREGEFRQTTTTTTTTTFYTPNRRAAESTSHEGYQAAICAVRDRRAVTSLPPVSPSLKRGITTGRPLEPQRGASPRDGALRAATGAFGNRRRADSAPSQALLAVSGTERSPDLLEDLGSSMEASRIQHAHTNARLYTASPPVGPELEERRRKSILQAAAVSMARDMYGITESKEGGPSTGALYGAQQGHRRARSQRSIPKPDQTVIQQVVTIQDIAQKRAAEKIASLEDETVIYREYYGIDQQPTRPSFSVRRRRSSNETDSSAFDAERSREIRTQMTTLRSRLDAVDEQREKDRASLLEAARKNVDIALQDMDMRIYADTGRAPAAMQKELEETAMERAMEGRREIDTEYPMADKVNIGSRKFIDMGDVEALARSRLQPTFDEINDRAETQRAKDLAERLDAEHQQRHREIEREREAEIKMEEKLHKAQLKQEAKSKEEKIWLWRRMSRRIPSSHEATVAKETTAATTGHEVNGVVQPEVEEAVPEVTAQNQPTDTAETAASGGVTEEAEMEPAARQESKLKSWFKDRLRRRSSVPAVEDQAAAAAPAEEGGVMESKKLGTVGASEGAGTTAQAGETSGVASLPVEASVAEEPEAGRIKIAKPVEETHPAAEGDSRMAALRSHPITANDIGAAKSGGQSAEDNEDRLNGMTTSEYIATQQGSKDKVEHNSDLKRNRLKKGLKKIVSKNSGDKTTGAANPEDETGEVAETTEQTATATQDPSNVATEREALRESAAEQGLDAPPSVVKQASNGTGRESRFSEDL